MAYARLRRRQEVACPGRTERVALKEPHLLDVAPLNVSETGVIQGVVVDSVGSVHKAACYFSLLVSCLNS